MKLYGVIFVILFFTACHQNQATNESQKITDPIATNSSHEIDTTKKVFTKKNDSMIVTIMIPDNIKKYEAAMNNYTDTGGPDPSLKWKFIPKEIHVPFTNDTLKASADAASKYLFTQGDSIVYFKRKGKTVFILLQMDVDGWAGVSHTINMVHPVVERTVLRGGGIEKVAFGNLEGK